MKETCLYLEKEKDLNYYDSNESLEEYIISYLGWAYENCEYLGYTDNGYYCKVYVGGI